MVDYTPRIAAGVLAVAVGCPAVGQGGGGGPLEDAAPWHQIECARLYVNPDPTIGNDNNSGAIGQPLLTIGWAINVATAQSPAVIVLMPGVYSSATNGEVYPIQMQDGVSLQGFAATNTVLQSNYWSNILEFRSTSGSFDDTMVDSLTLTGGKAAVDIRCNARRIGPTVSNCVMTDNAFGVRMQSYWDGFAYQYIRAYPRLVNDTIVNNDCGIFDIAFGGPDHEKGVAESAIINCAVIHNDSFNDLAGPDASDLSHTAFMWFDPSMVASGNQGPTSWPWVWDMSAANTFIDWDNYDYRQCCGSLLVGQGTQDLSVPNGNVAPRVNPCRMDIFDYDGEGYGNPRIEKEIDVGADEQGQLVVSGYMPMTTTFSQSSGGGAYSTVTIHHLPDPDPGYPAVARTVFGTSQVGDVALTPRQIPGLRAAGTMAPQDLKYRGVLWIDLNSIGGMYTADVGTFCARTELSPLVTMQHQLNYQEITIGPDGLSPFSNLQSFRFLP